MVWLLVARSNLCLGLEDDRQVWRAQRVGLQLSEGTQEEEGKEEVWSIVAVDYRGECG